MVLWPFPVEQRWAEGQVVPEHAFTADPGGFIGEHAKGCFGLGAAVVAVHAQWHRQGPGQLVQFRSPLAVRAAGGTAQASDQHHGRSRPW